MKKFYFVLIILFVAMFAFAGGSKEDKKTSDAVTVISDSAESSSSESISKTVATVNLIKQTLITEDDVQEALAKYQQYGISRETIINSLVEDELLSQAIERDGFDEYIDKYKEMYISQYRSFVESQLGREVTDAEFDEISIENNGGTVDEIFQEYAENYVARSYVQVAMADKFENAKLPTAEDIAAFYNQNVSSFVSAENVKLAHVFFLFGEDKTAAFAEAQNVATLIQKGQLSFENAVKTYSQDNNSKDKGGEIGYFSMDDKTNTESMGQNFVDEIFKLKVGQVSSVIESNVGYHIVLVSEHNPSKLLSLSDKISNKEDVTVSDYIKTYLTEQLQEELTKEAYKEVIAVLKDNATIKIIG